MENKLIILEGPDCAGKTTLAGKLNVHYEHATWDKDMDVFCHHTQILKSCLEHEYSVVDRLWLSELIYGNIFRNGPSYNIETMKKFIENNFRTKLIICLPPLEVVQKEFARRKETEMFDSVTDVWNAYSEIKGFKFYNYLEDDYDNTDFWSDL